MDDLEDESTHKLTKMYRYLRYYICIFNHYISPTKYTKIVEQFSVCISVHRTKQCKRCIFLILCNKTENTLMQMHRIGLAGKAKC